MTPHAEPKLKGRNYKKNKHMQRVRSPNPSMCLSTQNSYRTLNVASCEPAGPWRQPSRHWSAVLGVEAGVPHDLGTQLVRGHKIAAALGRHPPLELSGHRRRDRRESAAAARLRAPLRDRGLVEHRQRRPPAPARVGEAPASPHQELCKLIIFS